MKPQRPDRKQNPSNDILFEIHDELAAPQIFEREINRILSKAAPNYFTRQFIHDLQTAFIEGVANAIRHAQEIIKHGCLRCALRLLEDGLEMSIIDHGVGFDLEAVPLPRFEELAESGRGIFMMRQLVDELEYRKGATENELVLRRYFVGQNKQTQNLDILYDISQAILEDSNIDTIYHLLLQKMVDVFEVEKASIMRFDETFQRLKVVASLGLSKELSESIELRPGEGIAGYVFQHTKPCLIEDMYRQRMGWQPKRYYRSQSFMSAPMVAYPLQKKQRTIGVINLTDRAGGRSFTKNDLKMLTTIANQASAFVQIYELLNEAREADLLKKELLLARRIQQNYLPIRPPKIEGLELHGWLTTAQSVGGDYYDFIDCGARGLYVVIADVSGHDIAAAITMANFRSQLKAVVYREEDPGVILTELNRLMFHDLVINEQFITLVLLRFIPGTYRVAMARAGHIAPIHISQGHVHEMDAELSNGSILGLIQQETFKATTEELKAGDKLILYTDGLVEIVNGAKKRFSSDKLLEFVRVHRDAPIKTILEELRKEIGVFIDNGPIIDDITAIGMTFY